MATSTKAGDGLTVAVIKALHPHYTDAQAEAYLAAHHAAAPLRALLPEGPHSARLSEAISQIVRFAGQAAR